MLSPQILPSRVLRQIEGGNEGRACIVIDVHFHILNWARLAHRKMGFWILRRQQLAKRKLWLANDTPQNHSFTNTLKIFTYQCNKWQTNKNLSS